jgi:AcrR family transcriptional regulator
MPPDPLTAKGLQTRDALEGAARKLFAERGFHGTTLADITSAAGKSPAVFYRYYDDKEDLLARLAESFLNDVVKPSGLTVHLPESVRRAQDQGFGADLHPDHTGAAIALLFENFTAVYLRPSGLNLQISDEDAIATLSTIWKKTLYGY